LDEVTVVGGLVPSLLIPQEDPDSGRVPHVGTLDLDLGLSLGLLDGSRYQELADRLRQAHFHPDVNERGKPTRQRWRLEGASDPPSLVDFLIPPTREASEPGRLQNLEADLAAIVTPGLQLAFEDRERVTLQGETVLGERATRQVWVCGPGAYVVLKSLAFSKRGENKDAYDLFYLLQNYGAGVEDVARRLSPLLRAPEAAEAVEVLRRDFSEHDAVGPHRAAAFLHGGPDDQTQADVVGFVAQLLRLCKSAAG
jgi:hypothetical protein